MKRESEIDLPDSKRMSTTKKINHILFVIAMEQEAKPLLDKLKLTKIEDGLHTHAPSLMYSGKYKDITVSVVDNGKCSRFNVDNVGTVPATLSSFLAISNLKPDLVINAGTAGGFKSKGGQIGDSYIGTAFKNHDRRIGIPGFDQYGIGNYEAIPCPNLISTLKLKSGVVSTSNSLDHTEMDDKCMLENDASVKEMEAAAIAWVCSLSNTPFIAVKVITDIVDGEHPTHEEFLRNLSTAAHALQDTISNVLDYIVDKSIDQL